MIRAISGVLRNAQDGELPLFAWTLGLPQASLLALTRQCFPELGELEPMPEHDYDEILQAAPSVFHDLAQLLFDNRSAGVNEEHARWLAHAMAAAGFGSRQLWEDLDLDGREPVTDLVAQYFAPLYARNHPPLRWKRFFIAELRRLRESRGPHH